MDHKIGLKVGQQVRYMTRKYEVVDVYSHIVYLKDLSSLNIICLGIGDCVIGGLEPISRNPVPAKSTARVKGA